MAMVVMQSEKPSSGDVLTLHLPPTLGLDALQHWQALLLEQLTNRNTVALDARAVERISTPVLQLCLSALKSAQASGKTLAITHMSAAFSQGITTLAIDDSFTGEPNE